MTEEAETEATPEQIAWERQVGMVRQLYKPEVWDILSPELVLCFWSLSLSDVYFPKARHDPHKLNSILLISLLFSYLESCSLSKGNFLLCFAASRSLYFKQFMIHSFPPLAYLEADSISLSYH